MKGYVLNSAPIWAHVMKRAVGPGAKISLDDLYEQYGKKHGLAEGEEFVEWLKSVKLKDSNRWHINLEEEIPEETVGKIVEEVEEKEPIVNVVQTPKSGDMVSPIMPKEMEVGDVVELSVRKAREVLPTIRDLNLLKYALQEANQRANKDSLCRLLRKRIKGIEIAR